VGGRGREVVLVDLVALGVRRVGRRARGDFARAAGGRLGAVIILLDQVLRRIAGEGQQRRDGQQERVEWIVVF